MTSSGRSRKIKDMGTRLRLPAIAFGLAIYAAGCASDETDRSHKVFHAYLSGDVRTLDPADASDVLSTEVIPSIHETLYQYDYLANPPRIVPLLAADLPEISPDRLTVVIPIRRGIRFHPDPAFIMKVKEGPGRELTARDFLLAFKRLALPRFRPEGAWELGDRTLGFQAYRERMAKISEPKERLRELGAPIEGLSAPTDFMLRIRLSRPYPQLLHALARSFTAPVPIEVLRAYADADGALGGHSVGTGPFRLKRWSRGRTIVLERHEAYRPEFYPKTAADSLRRRGLLEDAARLLPFLDKIVFHVIRDPDEVWERFLAGELDQLTIPRARIEETVTAQGDLTPPFAKRGLKLSVDTGTRFFYLAFNPKDPVVGGASRKLLRQAISSAIDRKKWIELASWSRATKATTALPPGIADRPEKTKLKYDHDLGRAKELLAKAGFKDGHGLPRLQLELAGADTFNRRLGEFFREQLARIGIQLRVIHNTLPMHVEKLRKGEIQLAYAGWGMDYPDAEEVYRLLRDSLPGDARVKSLYERMALMEPGPARAALIRDLDGILQEEVPWALGYYHVDYHLVQPWVLNYRGTETIQNKYKYLRVDRDVKERITAARKR